MGHLDTVWETPKFYCTNCNESPRAHTHGTWVCLFNPGTYYDNPMWSIQRDSDYPYGVALRLKLNRGCP